MIVFHRCQLYSHEVFLFRILKQSDIITLLDSAANKFVPRP